MGRDQRHRHPRPDHPLCLRRRRDLQRRESHPGRLLPVHHPRLDQRTRLGARPRREPSRRRVLRRVPLGQRHQRRRFRCRAPVGPQQGVRPSDHHRHRLRRQWRRRRPTDSAGAQRNLGANRPGRRQPDLLDNHQRGQWRRARGQEEQGSGRDQDQEHRQVAALLERRQAQGTRRQQEPPHGAKAKVSESVRGPWFASRVPLVNGE